MTGRGRVDASEEAEALRRARGAAVLAALKEGEPDQSSRMRLPVGSPARAWLRPIVSRPGAISADDVFRLTEWRNRFRSAFLTEFQADEASTEKWIGETIHPDEARILFMLDDADGGPFGQIGLASIDWFSGSFEVDSVARGEQAPRGLMGNCLRTLVGWARSDLGLDRPWLRVRSDNTAIRFYERLGFNEVRRVPLRRRREGRIVRWVEDPGERSHGLAVVYMEWTNPPSD